MSTQNQNDYLGYDVYADSLWTRIQTALDKDANGKQLEDDPLVVGLFGEWGAGKSKLLSLIQEQAQKSANTLAERRKQDGGNFTLLVPVFFQPWKYEHEKHLHVPLMLHVLEALSKQIELAQTWSEWAGGKMPEEIKQHLGKVVSLVTALAAATALAVGVAVPLAASASFAGAGLLASLLQKFNFQKTTPLIDTFQHLENGRFFYEMQDVLKAITRPTSEQKYLTSEQLNTKVKINFVVFIDDLDRCLPENAIGTLELIKTVFNVESFAFVLALDDEVIERGIGHRYHAYSLAGKKPEMPITGFEYLEKIVHVPFRLPALTQEQGALFVRSYEKSIEEDATKRWFDAPIAEGGGGNKNVDAVNLRQAQLDLWSLVRACFDAYVPRKLIRLIELLHQTAAIAKERGKPLTLSVSGAIDIRVVLALLLIQLFQPELYRLMRRRMDAFPFLLRAFANETLKSPHVSDIDLLQWAVGPVMRSSAGGASSTKPPLSLSATIQAIADLDESKRADAQQVRLPVVAQLLEHRAAQRHVFDVLKLLYALAQNMGESAKSLTLAPYFSLLGQEERAASMPRYAVLDVQRLFDDWVSDDEAVVANMISRNEIPKNHVFSAASAVKLLELATRQGAKKLLNGLRHLAPYIAKEDGERFWDLVKDLNPIPTELNTITTEPKLAALYADVRYRLGQDKRFIDAGEKPLFLLRERLSGNDEKSEPIGGFVRIEGGKFTMGHEADKDDNPPREIDLGKAPFYMARTLTTVDQYAAFIADGGYDASKRVEWWDQQGIDWLEGRFDSLIEDQNYKQYLAWRKGDDRFKPWSWEEQQTTGSHPVYGITWFEARAYARWLNEQLKDELQKKNLSHYQVCLPTEVYWERAARQEAADRWPWGDDESIAGQRANVSESKIEVVSAVGCFVPNPLGLLDMAGNVWEWQDNLYVPNDKVFARVDRNRPLISKPEWRDSDLPGLRGGSWVDSSDFARCSSRHGDRPVGWDDDVGFRVMLSLVNLKSAT